MAVKPNLPDEKVTKVLMADMLPYVTEKLALMGIQTVRTVQIKGFLPFEQTHADMQFLPIDETIAAVLSEAEILKGKLEKLYKTFIIIPLGNNYSYPNNVKLNHTVIGNYVIGNAKAVDRKLTEVFENKNLTFINVNQGYSKCSTAVVSENALITADESIYKACVKFNFDMLKITPGNIILPGTDYGFIGGCCGKISRNVLAFTGSLKHHPDGKKISDFCKSHGVNVIPLSDGPLIDIGGIIPLG